MNSIDHAAALIRSFTPYDGWHVTHDLFFENLANAKNAAVEASRLGCEVRTEPLDDGSARVLVTYAALASPETIDPVASALEELAGRHSGEYVGTIAGYRKGAA